MSEAKNKRCLGVAGWLFGHNYKAIFETDVEKISAAEFEKMVASVAQHNFWSMSSEAIRPDPHANKRETQVYICHACTRCGDTINNEIIIDGAKK